MTMTTITSQYIDRWIDGILVSNNEIKESKHVSSGKLSASMLGKPLQSQILKAKGVPQKALDPYTLRKFQRGNDVEKWLVSVLPGLVTTQKFVEYRGVVGYVDAVVSTNAWEKNFGIIPLEVKSVTNAKYKMISKSGQADRGHILQSTLYALSQASGHFAITYVASDDYRVNTFVYKTSDYATEVNRIIDAYDKQLATGRIPEFKAEEKWMTNPKYADYPEFIGLTEEECNKKFKEEYESKK